MKRNNNFSNSQITAIRLLNELINYFSQKKVSKKGGKRFTRLLKEPELEFTQTWNMCLPAAFNDALDVKLTKRIVNKKENLEWTQGANFNFKAGDVIYDRKIAYTNWNKWLKNNSIAYQVVEASPASAVGSSGRDCGSVKYSVWLSGQTGDLKKNKIESCTQDDFIRILIAGPNSLKNTYNSQLSLL